MGDSLHQLGEEKNPKLGRSDPNLDEENSSHSNIFQLLLCNPAHTEVYIKLKDLIQDASTE